MAWIGASRAYGAFQRLGLRVVLWGGTAAAQLLGSLEPAFPRSEKRAGRADALCWQAFFRRFGHATNPRPHRPLSGNVRRLSRHQLPAARIRQSR
jgi:hypothetical protein